MSSEIRTRRNGLRLMLQGLGRNLRGGARLALFMPVRLSDFRISVGQFTLVYLLGVLAWLLGGMAREGLSGGLNLPALGQSLAQLPFHVRSPLSSGVRLNGEGSLIQHLLDSN